MKYQKKKRSYLKNSHRDIQSLFPQGKIDTLLKLETFLKQDNTPNIVTIILTEPPQLLVAEYLGVSLLGIQQISIVCNQKISELYFSNYLKLCTSVTTIIKSEQKRNLLNREILANHLFRIINEIAVKQPIIEELALKSTLENDTRLDMTEEAKINSFERRKKTAVKDYRNKIKEIYIEQIKT